MYRIQPNCAMMAAELEGTLAQNHFVECGSSQEKTAGWIEPRGEKHGPLLELVGGQMILKLMTEVKTVPSSVIHRKATERASQIEASAGRKPGKKELKEIKDEIRLSLLPMAFTKQAALWVWIDPDARLLVIDTSSQSRADEVITLLVKCIEGFAVTPINTALTPAVAMADWLMTQEPPPGFSIDRECELKAQDDSKAVVRYARHALDTDEVRQHIEGGKAPTRVALTWDSRLSFLLTDAMQVKKLTFLDVVFENSLTNKSDGFDADLAIMTSELKQLIPDLILALGGELSLA